MLSHLCCHFFATISTTVIKIILSKISECYEKVLKIYFGSWEIIAWGCSKKYVTRNWKSILFYLIKNVYWVKRNKKNAILKQLNWKLYILSKFANVTVFKLLFSYYCQKTKNYCPHSHKDKLLNFNTKIFIVVFLIKMINAEKKYQYPGNNWNDQVECF